MTNYAELAMEAEAFAEAVKDPHAAVMVFRLAAAVRELAPKEGWRWTEARKGKEAQVNESVSDPNSWVASTPKGMFHYPDKHPTQYAFFDTASAAMAALDGETS